MPFRNMNQNNMKLTGILSPETTDAFLDLVIQNTPILQEATAVPVKIGMGTYPTVAMARYKTRGFASTSAGRQAVATLQNLTQTDVAYSVQELVLPLVIQDSYLEDLGSNEEEIGQKMAEMVAKVFAKDLQYLVINGDAAATGSTDKILLQKTMDGLVEQLKDASATCAWASTDNTLMKKLKKLLSGSPDALIAAPNSKIYMCPGDYTTLWDEVVDGNKTLAVREGRIWYRHMPVIEMEELPTGRPVVGDMSNLFIPLKREVYLEWQRYPEARGTKVVLSTRIDIKLYPNANLRILAASAS